MATIGTGVLLGIAELTKLTWILLFPLWILLFFLWRFSQHRSARPPFCRNQLRLLAVFALAIYVVNVGYGFEKTGRPLGEFRFASGLLGDVCRHGGQRATPGNRFSASCAARIRTPLPANYVLGIDRQRFEFERGYWSYLRGEWRRGGWWYYYLYALAIKEPLGTWVLAILALLSGWPGRGYSATWRDELLVVAPLLTVLAFVSSQTGFSHHLRYVLPMYPFAFIWISKVARSVTLGHRGTAMLAGCALAWSVSSSLYHYPHCLSYFNELVGGPKHGYKHLLNSNLDWGQDLLFLKGWLEKHPEAQPIGLAYSLPERVLDPADLGLSYTLPLPGPESAPFAVASSPAEFGPSPGWFAIFVGAMRERHRRYAYFEQFQPAETLGYTVRIYHISLDDANRVRRKLGLRELQPPERAVVDQSTSRNGAHLTN